MWHAKYRSWAGSRCCAKGSPPTTATSFSTCVICRSWSRPNWRPSSTTSRAWSPTACLRCARRTCCCSAPRKGCARSHNQAGAPGTPTGAPRSNLHEIAHVADTHHPRRRPDSGRPAVAVAAKGRARPPAGGYRGRERKLPFLFSARDVHHHKLAAELAVLVFPALIALRNGTMKALEGVDWRKLGLPLGVSGGSPTPYSVVLT